MEDFMHYPRLVFSALMLSSLIGCTNTHIGYNIEVQQGNIITSKMVKQLHVGMTREEVQNLLGEPVVCGTFNDNRWDYAYTYSRRGHPLETEHYSLLFRGDKLVKINHWES